MGIHGRRPTPQQALQQIVHAWKQRRESAFWVFGYASLIWRPEFEEAERRPATVYGWHRSLGMWSTINRGTPEQPGLVFALQQGGSCKGMALRIRADRLDEDLHALWAREMPTGVYDPRWLACRTPHGRVLALAFTLHSQSPRCCGQLSDEQLHQIFSSSQGRYGTTRDYAVSTYESLQSQGIDDVQLRALLSRGGVALAS